MLVNACGFLVIAFSFFSFRASSCVNQLLGCEGVGHLTSGLDF